MSSRSTPVFRRSLQPEDVSDTRKLYQHLSSRDRDITDHLQSIKADLDTQRAARKLTSSDLSEISQHFRDPKNFSIDSLPGFALDPQNPNIPTLSVLPDPNVTLYTMVAVTNAQSNSLYRLDDSKVPKVWQKVGDLAGLSSTGPGVVKQVTAGAALTISQLTGSDLITTPVNDNAIALAAAGGGVISGGTVVGDYIRVGNMLFYFVTATGWNVTGVVTSFQFALPALMKAAIRAGANWNSAIPIINAGGQSTGVVRATQNSNVVDIFTGSSFTAWTVTAGNNTAINGFFAVPIQ